jgi:hypothetical protein
MADPMVRRQPRAVLAGWLVWDGAAGRILRTAVEAVSSTMARIGFGAGALWMRGSEVGGQFTCSFTNVGRAGSAAELRRLGGIGRRLIARWLCGWRLLSIAP